MTYLGKATITLYHRRGKTIMSRRRRRYRHLSSSSKYGTCASAGLHNQAEQLALLQRRDDVGVNPVLVRDAFIHASVVSNLALPHHADPLFQ